jgi:ABC-type sugar transport system ATPase subunit
VATLDILNLAVRRGDRRVLEDVTLNVADGEMVAIIGGSGSGKTTLLRAVAGLEHPDSGEVRIAGIVQDSSPSSRDVAMVFQESVLYPFMDVASNVAFPLDVRGVTKPEIDARVKAEGRALGIDHLLHRNPNELSAGYKHLSQVARAMVRRPELFLMDEPLSGLDAGLRLKMRDELKMIQRGYGVTTLYVTNDPTEAMSMVDRAVVLEGGVVTQDASTEDLYHRPVDRRVAELMGDLDVIPVTVESDAEGWWLVRDGLRLRAWAPALRPYVGRRIDMATRPEYLEPSESADAVLHVTRVVFHGPYRLAAGEIAGAPTTIRTRYLMVRPGDAIPVRVARSILLDATTGRTIVAA